MILSILLSVNCCSLVSVEQQSPSVFKQHQGTHTVSPMWQVGAQELERAVSGSSEGSGEQLARTNHYIGPVASDALAQSWMHWGDTSSHMLTRQAGFSRFLIGRVAFDVCLAVT